MEAEGTEDGDEKGKYLFSDRKTKKHIYNSSVKKDKDDQRSS